MFDSYARITQFFDIYEIFSMQGTIERYVKQTKDRGKEEKRSTEQEIQVTIQSSAVLLFLCHSGSAHLTSYSAGVPLPLLNFSYTVGTLI